MLTRLLATLRRKAAGHDRLFRFLHDLSLQEQAIQLLRPGAERVAVLAPHMDDEVLGCGGTLAAHIDAGAQVDVIFLTGGRYGAGPGAPPQADLEAQRRAEAEAAGAALGVRQRHYIAGAGNRLESDLDAARELRAILERLRPAVVYLPFIAERHPDHRATTEVMANAVAGTALQFECRTYEVWTPLVPNRAVAIDAYLERKRAAIACYHSQLAHTDFAHIALGLNAYRSSAVQGECRHVECFYAAPLARYLALARAFRASLPS